MPPRKSKKVLDQIINQATDGMDLDMNSNPANVHLEGINEIEMPADLNPSQSLMAPQNSEQEEINVQIARSKYKYYCELFPEQHLPPVNPMWSSKDIEKKLHLAKMLSGASCDASVQMVAQLTKTASKIIEGLISMVFVDASGFSEDLMKNDQIEKLVKTMAVDHFMKISFVSAEQRFAMVAAYTLIQTVVKNKMKDAMKNAFKPSVRIEVEKKNDNNIEVVPNSQEPPPVNSIEGANDKYGDI